MHENLILQRISLVITLCYFKYHSTLEPISLYNRPLLYTNYSIIQTVVESIRIGLHGVRLKIKKSGVSFLLLVRCRAVKQASHSTLYCF